jgi:hypothetical protein
VIDIGHGVSIEPLTDSNGAPDGYAIEHVCSYGRTSSYLDPLRWRTDKSDPLTLSPSVACTNCGHHGFVREGKWVPA